MNKICLTGISTFTFLLVLSMKVASPLAADPRFCQNIERLVEQAASNFADTSVKNDGKHLLILSGAPDCSIAQLATAAAYHCVWTFPLQAPAARRQFADLVSGLLTCLGPGSLAERDQGVNHPDFYDARRFETGGIELIVSIKDKSALENTFVNLRVHAAAP